MAYGTPLIFITFLTFGVVAEAALLPISCLYGAGRCRIRGLRSVHGRDLTGAHISPLVATLKRLRHQHFISAGSVSWGVARLPGPGIADGCLRGTQSANNQGVLFARRSGVPFACRLTGKIYLEAFPGAYGVIKILLGHKNIDTTIRTYCGTEHAAVYRRYDEFLEARRGVGRHKTPIAHNGRRVR